MSPTKILTTHFTINLNSKYCGSIITCRTRFTCQWVHCRCARFFAPLIIITNPFTVIETVSTIKVDSESKCRVNTTRGRGSSNCSFNWCFNWSLNWRWRNGCWWSGRWMCWRPNITKGCGTLFWIDRIILIINVTYGKDILFECFEPFFVLIIS